MPGHEGTEQDILNQGGADAPQAQVFSRRDLLAWSAGIGGLAALAPLEAAAAPHRYRNARASAAAARQNGRAQPMPHEIAFPAQYQPGTIIVSLGRRRLFLTSGPGRAIVYPVAVGKAGRSWQGWARVDGKHVNPAWSPPAVVRASVRGLPDIIPGGAPNNPMGPRALTLDRHEIAIHGTTRSMRRSIGSAASFGCIRMYNEDIVDLFDRVRVGTPVLSIA